MTESYAGETLPFQWSDLRERQLGQLDEGDTMVKLGFGCAYRTGGPDGEISGVFGLPCGSAWTITEIRGNSYTVMRTVGEATQTFTRPADFKVLAVVPDAR